MAGVAFFDIDSLQLEEGVVATEYERPAPAPDYPSEVHSLNNFDIISQKSEGGMIDGIDIGGRNLMLNSAVLEASGLDTASGSRAEYRTINTGQSYMDLEDGEVITISFDIEMKIATKNPSLQVYNSNRLGPVGIPSVSVGNQIQGAVGETINKRISFTTYATLRDSPSYSYNTLEFYSIYGTDNFYKISKLKVERGNKATDWTPAPEDITENDNNPLIDKFNLLLDEPLRSVGDIKDRLFRDSDGLWKIERKIGSDNDLHNNTYWANISNYHTDNSSIFGIPSLYYSQAKESGVMISSHFVIDRSLNGVSDGQGIFLSTNPRLRLRVWNTLVGIEIGDSTSVKLTKFKNWLANNPISIQYELGTPIIETLDSSLQDKLNNLRSFQDSNYVYTVINDKTYIISENLKPTLHATFKGGGWYSRWKTEKEFERHQDEIDNKAESGALNNLVQTVTTETERLNSISTDVESTKNNFLITHTDEYVNKITTTESSLDGLESRIVSVEETKENVDTFFQFDDAFTIGKSNAQTKLRMTNDEIQFLDGETKGTYITGNTMVSQNIQIQDKLNLPKHTFETEGDITVVKYIG